MKNGIEYRLKITVIKVEGKCPVFKVGEKIVLEPPKIVVEDTDNICLHALSCISTMLVPLSHGISFKKLGLAREDGDKGYFQCLDPGKPYTDGGTVLFEIRREKG